MTQIVERVWEQISEQMRAESESDIPEQFVPLAVREALVNVIAHRDYTLSGRQLEARLYEDRLEGRIDTATYDRKAVELRRKTRSAEERLAALKNPSRTRGTERPHSGTLELARTASREYSRRSGPEKREMLDYLVSNCSWGDGRLDVEFKHPYALLAVANAEYRQKKAAGEPSDGLCQLWYPRRDSNTRIE